MTLFQMILVYAVSWWLVLFMVLPYRAHAPQVPGKGHAQSAPENPLLRQKLIWTSIFALMLTAALYVLSGFVSFAHAADDDIYHASSGVKTDGKCKSRVYHAPADINAVDGQGSSGKQVAPATIGGAGAVPTVDLNLNGDKYVAQPGQPTPAAPASPNSYLGLGKVAVGADGSVTMDNKPLAPAANDDCKE